MSTLNNRILIAIAASALLAMAGPVALTAVSPAAYNTFNVQRHLTSANPDYALWGGGCGVNS